MTQPTQKDIQEKTKVFSRDVFGDQNAWREERVQSGSGMSRGEKPFDELLASARKFAGSTGKAYRGGLLEEAIGHDPQARNLLRTGLRYYAFQGAESVEDVYLQVTTPIDSNLPEEYYLTDGTFGRAPRSPSGSELQMVNRNIRDRVRIENHRYAMGAQVTNDEIRFDRIGMIAQTASQLGAAMQRTRDYETFEEITKASNYDSVKADNDEGNNTPGNNTTNLNAENFITAYNTLTTMKDRDSGAYMGVMPTALICAPKAGFWAQRLFLATSLSRIGSGVSASEQFGTGDLNVFSMITRIIITPLMGDDYQWAIFDPRPAFNGLMFQEVESLNVETEAANMNSEAYITYDSIRYRATDYYGVGFRDDRAWYYSPSTTKPEVD